MITLIPTYSIEPWEHNPRGREKFSEKELAVLAASMRREGQHHAVTVRRHPTAPGKYQLADGERRWRVALAIGLAEMEARVRELDDAGMFRLALSSGREGSTLPLSPIEEAYAYHKAMKALALTQAEVAKLFGAESGQQHVSDRLALLDLPPAAVAAMAAGELRVGTAEEIARIPDAKARGEVASLVLKDRTTLGVMPLERVRAHIRAAVYRPLSGAPFDPKDETLVPAAGACGECPHASREGRGRLLCTRPSCFAEKMKAARVRVVAREVAKGRKVLSDEESAQVFPPGGQGIALGAGWVAADRPVPPDLLKKEVTKAPAWSEVCGEVATRHLAFDQAGRLVELYNLREALLAADERECAIFNAETIRRYNLDRGAESLKKERRVRVVVDEGPPAAAEAKASGWEERAVVWIGAVLEAAPTLPPKLREDGFQILREAGAPILPVVAAAEESGDMEALRKEAVAEFEARGLHSKASRDRVTRLVCGGMMFEDVGTTGQMRKLLAMLRKKVRSHEID